MQQETNKNTIGNNAFKGKKKGGMKSWIEFIDLLLSNRTDVSHYISGENSVGASNPYGPGAFDKTRNQRLLYCYQMKVAGYTDLGCSCLW